MEKVLRSFNLMPITIVTKDQWFNFVNSNHNPTATLDRLFAHNKQILNWIAVHSYLHGMPWDKGNGKDIKVL